MVRRTIEVSNDHGCLYFWIGEFSTGNSRHQHFLRAVYFGLTEMAETERNRQDFPVFSGVKIGYRRHYASGTTISPAASQHPHLRIKDAHGLYPPRRRGTGGNCERHPNWRISP